MPAAPEPSRPDRSTASLDMRAGPLSAELHVDASPTMIVAVGAMVSTILLSTAVLVRASVRSAAHLEREKRQLGKR